MRSEVDVTARVRSVVCHLAGVQHVSDGSSAEVRGGDHVLLAAGVPSSHCFSRGQRDAFGHADELLWGGRLWRRICTAEHLMEGRRTCDQH